MVLIVGGAYSGQLEFTRDKLKIAENNIYSDFHLKMKNLLLLGGKPEELVRRILQDKTVLAVTSDDIGSGIVPANASDRRWREETGRALCRLAENAGRVYVVRYGIGRRIK